MFVLRALLFSSVSLTQDDVRCHVLTHVVLLHGFDRLGAMATLLFVLSFGTRVY